MISSNGLTALHRMLERDVLAMLKFAPRIN
jgi:hypothetical protein